MVQHVILKAGVAAAAAGMVALALTLSPATLLAESGAKLLPAPAVDMPAAGVPAAGGTVAGGTVASGTAAGGPAAGGTAAASPQTVVFAGGCFWGIQGVFEHVKGVTQAVSGYAGGSVANPSYEQVSSGDTGHAESVRVTFDPSQVSYGTLLRIFFSVALDPTEVNRQGPDWGTQYRSELFVSGPEQAHVAKAYIAQLDNGHVFSKPIATKVDPAGPFYPAEGYHQDYLDRHPDAPYIAFNDIPKVQALQKLFPDYWRQTPVTVGKLASSE